MTLVSHCTIFYRHFLFYLTRTYVPSPLSPLILLPPVSVGSSLSLLKRNICYQSMWLELFCWVYSHIRTTLPVQASPSLARQQTCVHNGVHVWPTRTDPLCTTLTTLFYILLMDTQKNGAAHAQIMINYGSGKTTKPVAELLLVCRHVQWNVAKLITHMRWRSATAEVRLLAALKRCIICMGFVTWSLN